MHPVSRSESLPVVDGTIVNPCYLEHKHAKNWVASVTADYSGAPGGLVRSFFKHGPRNRVFVPDDLAPGMWLEFGGDKHKMGGGKDAKRLYYEVTSVTPEEIGVRRISFDEIGHAKDADAAPPVEKNPLEGFSDLEIWNEALRRGLPQRFA